MAEAGLMPILPLSRTGALAMGGLAMASVGGSVAVSGVLTDAPLFTAQAVRYAAAALLLLVLARVTGNRIRTPRGTEWLWLLSVAATGLVLFNVALVRGAAHAEPAALGVAVACVPVVLALVGPLLEGGRPAPRAVLAATVVTVGAVLVQSGGRTDLAGLGWAATVLVCEVGFTLLAVPVLRRHGPWSVSVHTCWIAAAQLVVLGAGTEGLTAVTALRVPHLLAIAYLAVVLTAIAFVLWYSAVGRLGTALAGLLTGVAPVAAAAVGVALGAPVPGAAVWAGTALVLAGLLVGVRRNAPRIQLRRVPRGHHPSRTNGTLVRQVWTNAPLVQHPAASTATPAMLERHVDLDGSRAGPDHGVL